MNIEKDFLTKIFEGDKLFVFSEENTSVEYKDSTENDSILNEVAEKREVVESSIPQSKKVEKEVLILLPNQVEEAEKETLHKLLKAIGIEKDQYEVINDHPDSLQSIQHLKLFLSFHNQYLQSEEYSILKINKGNAIYAHSLSDLNTDQNKKLMLWNLLKKIV